MRKRIGIFGWGIVAPRSPDIEAFARNLEASDSWLTPFNGFGPDNFLVGIPAFDFAQYRPWIDARFPPRRFAQLEQKMDKPSLYAIGAFIQSLGQNPGLEAVLQELGPAAHVYIGSGIGNIGTIAEASVTLEHAQAAWNAFWSDPARNSALRAVLDGAAASGDVPPDPSAAPPGDRAAAERRWREYWMARSPELAQYLAELAEIEGIEIHGEVESGKVGAMRARESMRGKLRRKWGAPEAPWQVSANVVWNLHNTPAAQVTMLGQIKGLAFAPVAACSTFGVALRLAMTAIRAGEARAVVVGATDPPPHPLIVGAFYSARVLTADRRVSVPLTRLQGTHVSGGSVVWIVADDEYMTARGFKRLGLEPLAVGVSSDAHHIITPSPEGPASAIEQALAAAGVDATAVGTWDMHATATPGDVNEVAVLRSVLPSAVLATARKGTFGHGMSAGGGWELTAQYLGYARGRLFPTTLTRDAVNPAIAAQHEAFVLDEAHDVPSGLAGKLSIGIGGINACVLSRAWEE